MQRGTLAETYRGTETILVVEDDAAVRSGIRRLLQWAGYQVLAAADSDEAVRQATDHHLQIHLLLIDFSLPGTTGQELAVVLQGFRPSLRVVFMSGYSEEELPRTHSPSDAAFLQKPFATETLLLQVRNALHPIPSRSDAVG
jgi:two-component system, cell cycle sensor histidine kinase and response regulator CckA